MRLIDGVSGILGLGGGSQVGGRLFSGLKSVIVPSSIEALCKLSVHESGSIESVMSKAGSKLQRIEESAFYSGGLKSIVIQSSIEVLCESCFSNCQSF
jgi:hypothetical protein